MVEPWTFSGEIARVGQQYQPVTLVEGASFCISDAAGDIAAGTPHGLFFLDTRFLSRFELTVDGRPLESLGVSVGDAFAATFLCRATTHPAHSDSPLVVVRRRWVGYGLRELVEIRNHHVESRRFTVELSVGSDFANLFAVKEGRVRLRGAYGTELEPDAIRFSHRSQQRVRGCEIGFDPPADVDGDRATWVVELPPSGVWELTVSVTGSVESAPIPPRYPGSGTTESARAQRRLAEWRERAPLVESDNHALVAAVRRSVEDLGALRLFDPDYPDLPVVAAGAPWFMTLFGRDSLLTAWMALPVDVDLARGVVETLARLQGTKVDPDADEEPGKILHEVRFLDSRTLSLGEGSVYYGSIDATPLFVMLLGELRRWGLADDVVERLLPHADRALDWIAEFGDRDGDGFVEYARGNEHGLANQGWKDSWDGIRFADGTVAQAPLALCEVQGYVYAAYVARAHFAAERDDQPTFERYRRLAADLKARFNRDFWLPGRGWFAVGLDRDKRPVDSLASNIGHCLWTGIVDEDKAAEVARRLLSPEMFSGWGVRTLATSAGGYNPVSYHCGSVWPHDNAILAAGLMRYGFVAEAHRIVDAMLDVTVALGGRLPELFAGVAREEVPVPAAYPTSCVPQAWAAAAPLHLLRTVLRLDPWLPRGKVWLAPELPASIGRLRLGNIRLGDGTVTIDVTGDGVSVTGLPPGVELLRAPRRPLTATLPVVPPAAAGGTALSQPAP